MNHHRRCTCRLEPTGRDCPDCRAFAGTHHEHVRRLVDELRQLRDDGPDVA